MSLEGYAWKPASQAVNDYEVLQKIGLKNDEVVYFHNDVFAFAKTPYWDAAVIAQLDNIGQPWRRLPGVPRDDGFPAAGRLAQDLMTAIQITKRRDAAIQRPSLYGRIFGEGFEFNHYDKAIVPNS